jgi:poly-gamma-glutamate synthesis protein (capsule biosynthesis protein)
MPSLQQQLQPSMAELARTGNFQAIAYWLNRSLMPHGMYARVGATKGGCLPILVEFQRSPALAGDRLVRFICHQIWQLNCEAIDGVQVAARWSGKSQLLWKQSVRIVTPANQRRRKAQPPTRSRRSCPVKGLGALNYKTIRALLMVGSATAAFVLGCWFSYYDTHSTQAAARSSQTVTSSAPPPKRPDTVRAALEAVSVVEHRRVLHPDDPTVTLMFAGNVTLSDGLYGNSDRAFARLSESRQADVAMVNWYDSFPGDRAVDWLQQGGIDIVSFANEPSLAPTPRRWTEAFERLENAGIHAVGAGRTVKETRRPEILDVKGQRIAYLSYYAEDLPGGSDDRSGINRGDRDRIAEDIRALRDRVDWIVVNYHWGSSLASYPEQWQIDLAQFAIDRGADAIVGHHPHVLQGAQIYKGRPIAYSLGNFIFGKSARRDYNTAALKISLDGRKMKVEFLPVEVRQFQPRVAKGDRGREILRHLHAISEIFERPMISPVILDRQSERSQPSQEPQFPRFPNPDPTEPLNPSEEDAPFNRDPFTMGGSRE